MSRIKPVEYCLTLVYEGYDPEFDRQIGRKLRADAESSGYGFGERDLIFYFNGVEDANAAFARAKRIKGLTSVVLERA